jgi:hypothetical protein
MIFFWVSNKASKCSVEKVDYTATAAGVAKKSWFPSSESMNIYLWSTCYNVVAQWYSNGTKFPEVAGSIPAQLQLYIKNITSDQGFRFWGGADDCQRRHDKGRRSKIYNFFRRSPPRLYLGPKIVVNEWIFFIKRTNKLWGGGVIVGFQF